MPRKLPCSVCGVVRLTGSGSLPAGRYTCHPCRRIERAPYGRRVIRLANCTQCGTEFESAKRSNGQMTACCSKSCAVNLRASQLPGRLPTDHRRTRYERELAVAGLTRHQRDALREQWKRTGRRCLYCAARPVETVDHVVPLIRGGSNFEGNLVPACRPCNSSKRDLLLIEWRVARAAKLRLLQQSVHSAAA